MVLEQSMTGTVIGEMLGIPGNGRRVTFGILHVFGLREGLKSREQVWIDSGSIVAQLTTPRSSGPQARRSTEGAGQVRIATLNCRR
jgi:hypothetical protein